MNKTLIIIFALVIIFIPRIALAATATDSATTPTTSPSGVDDQKVKKIIDLVASSVAEQKLVAKVGILGTVTDVTTTKLTLNDPQNQTQIVDIDEITKFSSPENKNYGVSDITKGNYLGIIGLLNRGSDHILGRFINAETSVPVYFEGVITDVDRVNYQLTAVDEAGHKEVLDNQTSTKISAYTSADGQFKSGFSKMAAGERVFAAGFPDSKIKNQLEIDRVVYFPNLAVSDKMKMFVTPSAEAVSPTVKPTAVK